MEEEDGEEGPDELAGVSSMLDSICKRGAENATEVTDPEGIAALASIQARLRSKLHAYQLRGVAWMVEHEATKPPTTLHPAWMELCAADGTRLYLHSYTGEASVRFFAAPESVTCGGMLCEYHSSWPQTQEIAPCPPFLSSFLAHCSLWFEPHCGKRGRAGQVGTSPRLHAGTASTERLVHAFTAAVRECECAPPQSDSPYCSRGAPAAVGS